MFSTSLFSNGGALPPQMKLQGHGTRNHTLVVNMSLQGASQVKFLFKALFTIHSVSTEPLTDVVV